MTEFLLHLGVLVIAAGATVALRVRQRLVDVPLADLAPSAVDVAFLRAGWERLVETTIAVLMRRKEVRIGRAGVLSLANHRKLKPRTELERVILTRIEAGTTVKTLKSTLSDHALIAQARMSLVDRRLLLSLTPADRLKAASPLIVATVVGVFLLNAALTLLTFALLVIALLPVHYLPYAARRTTAGDYMIDNASETDAVTMVALEGLGAYPDPVLAKALRNNTRVGNPGEIGCASSPSGGGCGSGGS
ncbi:hypothetical protein LWC34_43965 [Kibdelosporangium philippinense]|uniref:TIGR04222 domain-containing membrane protein n=1 Tax=Kibdelosporangium philippinense TaxID=211113 RepID=A0ABS8ZPP0_9PSEU|nr:hypothetical protein [Kibdelosporangium philippinense]MCE7009720.1 hypothetical protein [Kibdelosporangium philippinense]